MVKIRALNESGSSDNDENTCSSNQKHFRSETREENLQKLYAQYLQCVQNGDTEEAKYVLVRLYELLQELDLEDASPVQRKLHFLTLKNLGDLFVDRIDFYVAALAIDEKDVILWIKTARRAFSVCCDYVLCRNCLHQVLRLSPRNWVALDMLLDCLYILGDNNECMEKSMYALSIDPSYLKGCFLAHELSQNCLYLKNKYESKLNKYIDETLLKRESEHFQTILSNLNRLKQDRLDKLNEVPEIEMSEEKIDTQKEQHETTNVKRWEVNGTSMAQIGEQLIRLYAAIRYDTNILQTYIDVIWNQTIGEQTDMQATTTVSHSQANDKRESLNDENLQVNSGETNSKSQPEESNKEGSQSSRSNPMSRLKDDLFPYEFIDKRRSTRVQRIQSKGRDGQDKSVFDSITEIFNACNCFSDSVHKQSKLDLNPTNASQSNTSDEIQLSQQEIDLSVSKEFFASLQQLNNKPQLLPMLLKYMETVIKNLHKSKAPLVFRDIYRVYRHHKALFDVDAIEWNVNFTENEFWSMLCSLELHFNRVEWFFLWDLLIKLDNQLSCEQTLNAKVRLIFVKGVHENRISYLQTAFDLYQKAEINRMSSATHPKFTLDVIKGQIDAQTVHNLHFYLDNKQYDKLFELISPEMQLNDNELDIICKAFILAEQFEKGIEFFSHFKNNKFTEAQLQILLTCIQNTQNAILPMRAIKKLINQSKDCSSASILIWNILLTILIMNSDHVADAHVVKFIELAHDHLGSKGKCTDLDGKFLLLCLDYLLNCCNEMEDELVLQCFHCLFDYNRRGYSFVSHTNTHIKMTWNSAEYVYSYFTPEQLPEFDTLSKNASINSEVKDFLKEIVSLMPSEMHPEKVMPSLNRYLDEGVSFSPDRSAWQQKADKRALIMKNIFYFLADYYFKNKEFIDAITYYKLDLCLNPNRFDSWAATALSMTNLIDEQILNDSPEYYQPIALFKDAARTVRIFSSALALDKQNTKIWIEFGTFVYNIASYASKVKKAYQSLGVYLQSHKISLQMSPDELEEKRMEMLKLTKYCFETSLQMNADEEMWLHYYLLGKVHEKQDVIKALDYYDLADKHLYLSGAVYPKRISYSPQSLSLEALEVHYRIHAAVLKCILRENKISVRRLARMKMHLLNALRSPFAHGISIDDKMASTMLNSFGQQFELQQIEQLDNFSIEELIRRTPQDVLCVVDDVVNVTCDRVSGKPNDIKITLVNLCLIAFKRCLSRFNNHYKSLYRLAHYFYNAGNLDMAKNVFMNCFEYNDLVTGNKCTINGLFYERKPNNFFNGIWRIPVDEVERSGNFSRHLFNCVQLLIQMSAKECDYNFLGSTLAVQLSRTPDVNKKYLRNIERVYLAQKSCEAVIELLKDQFTLLHDESSRRAKLMETVQIFEKLAKLNIFVEESNMILDQCRKLLTSSQFL